MMTEQEQVKSTVSAGIVPRRSTRSHIPFKPEAV